jgi:hypothetical protein
LPNNQYYIQVSDFGLCDITRDAVAYIGMPFFMALEVLLNQDIKQNPNVDIRSLFTTIAYVLDVDSFQQKGLPTKEQKIGAAVAVASTKTLEGLNGISTIDPTRRALAAQMPVRLLDGRGFTTPAHAIQASPSPVEPVTDGPR